MKCWKTNEIGQPSYEQLGTGLFEVWVVRAHVDINERAIVKTRLSKVYEISESGFKRNWKVKKNSNEGYKMWFACLYKNGLLFFIT